jgi:hypothetical protein
MRQFFQKFEEANPLADQDQSQQSRPLVDDQTGENLAAERTVKRKFVEPEISQPVDVLEATTFFQAIESGPTN